MKVKQLIQKLRWLDGDITIYTEQSSSYDTNSVLVAKHKATGRMHAYVGDDFDALKTDLIEQGYDVTEM